MPALKRAGILERGKKQLKKRLTILHSNDMHGDFLAKEVDDKLLGGVSMLSGYVNKVRNEEDEKFICEKIPQEDLLGMIHYNTEVIDADRQGKSPYDFSNTVVDEIMKIKDKIDHV